MIFGLWGSADPSPVDRRVMMRTAMHCGLIGTGSEMTFYDGWQVCFPRISSTYRHCCPLARWGSHVVVVGLINLVELCLSTSGKDYSNIFRCSDQAWDYHPYQASCLPRASFLFCADWNSPCIFVCIRAQATLSNPNSHPLYALLCSASSTLPHPRSTLSATPWHHTSQHRGAADPPPWPRLRLSALLAYVHCHRLFRRGYGPPQLPPPPPVAVSVTASLGSAHGGATAWLGSWACRATRDRDAGIMGTLGGLHTFGSSTEDSVVLAKLCL